jgi:DNA helicase-2/ATP-dependent DNA helicase PcrA
VVLPHLAIHIVNYAQSAYEGFEGEPDFDLDAVDSRPCTGRRLWSGLSPWSASMTANRFPPTRTGKVQDWCTPGAVRRRPLRGQRCGRAPALLRRHDAGDDCLSVTPRAGAHQTVPPSPYYTELRTHEVDPADVVIPPIEAGTAHNPAIKITFSELATFLDCAMAYRLRNLIGFQPRLAPELGYAKAVHHLFSNRRRSHWHHGQLKAAARRLVAEYIAEHADDFHRVWETERPFELHLEGVTVSGRADVIPDHEGACPRPWPSSTTRPPPVRTARTISSCRCTPTPVDGRGSTYEAPTSTIWPLVRAAMST